MALSSLVPQTVSSISLLPKSTITGLQIWSLYGLLLTIEASGFSYVTHVQVLESVYTLYCSKGGIFVFIIISLFTSKDDFSLALSCSSQSCYLLYLNNDQSRQLKHALMHANLHLFWYLFGDSITLISWKKV